MIGSVLQQESFATAIRFFLKAVVRFLIVMLQTLLLAGSVLGRCNHVALNGLARRAH